MPTNLSCAILKELLINHGTKANIKEREGLLVVINLHRRYLKKDTEEKFSHLRHVLQRSLNWCKEKLPKEQTAVPSTEVPEQVVNEEERSLGFSSSIVLQPTEQPEVNHRYESSLCDLSCLYSRASGRSSCRVGW